MKRIEIFARDIYTEVEATPEMPVTEAAHTVFSGLCVVLSQVPDRRTQLKILRVGTKMAKDYLKTKRKEKSHGRHGK